MHETQIELFQQQGYVVLPQFFDIEVLQSVKDVVQSFHKAWIMENFDFYQQQAINSAYLTGKQFLSEAQRQCLFEFLGSHELMNSVKALLGNGVCFMNTQLFFDPVNPQQANYWHRDTQYHLSPEEQQAALSGPQVLHFRIPLVDEPGLELVPGSHRNWDNDEELRVRLEVDGHSNSEPLVRGKVAPLSAGDLLIFSANMIHRGLYGNGRLALDVLFCDPVAALLQFVAVDCLPNKTQLEMLEDATAFENSVKIINSINNQGDCNG